MWPIIKLPLKGFITSSIIFFVLTFLLVFILHIMGLTEGEGGAILATFIITGTAFVSLILFIVSVVLGIVKQTDKSYNRQLSSWDIRFFVYGVLSIIICLFLYLVSYLLTYYK